ncbi:MAG: GNAT family N-acetyltransferase [Bryobacteraceae bacterium]
MKQIIRIARQDGLKVLWFQVLGETVYRRMAIYRRNLDGRGDGLMASIPVRVTMLTANDLDEYESLRPDAGAAEALRRMGEGQFCWVAWSDTQIIGEIWANPRSGWIDYLQNELPLNPGQVYIYQNFTRSDFRHKGVSAALLAASRRDLRKRGYRESIGVIRPDKINARTPGAMAPNEEIGRIGYWRLGSRRRHFLRWFPAGFKAPSRAGNWDDVSKTMAAGNHRLDPLLAKLKRQAHGRLVERWAGPAGGLCLKTDVFEEAFDCGDFLDVLARRGVAIGMDVSAVTAQRAQERFPGLSPMVAADVRQLPFASGSFALVVSPSTLDHFEDPRDLTVSLREMARVLRPGGRMIVTLDNRRNFLDTLLRAASRLRLTPYYLGRSYTIDELCRQMEAVGVRVLDRTAIIHGPRLVPTTSMRVAGWLGGGRMKQWVQRRLESAERLEGTRWRYRTGAFIAAVAEK